MLQSKAPPCSNAVHTHLGTIIILHIPNYIYMCVWDVSIHIYSVQSLDNVKTNAHLIAPTTC